MSLLWDIFAVIGIIETALALLLLLTIGGKKARGES
jgi:hypothetical protein